MRLPVAGTYAETSTTHGDRDRLRSAVDALLRLPASDMTPEAFASRFGATLAIAEACVANGLALADVSQELKVVRKMVAASKLVWRLQAWPRGYPGDFETIEWIVQRWRKERPGTVAFAAEQWALDCVPCQQHRNKIATQSQLIVETLRRVPTGRILSVASGPNCDVRRVAADLASSDCRLILNDADADALRFTRLSLSVDALRKIEFVAGNVLTAIRELSARGPFDLILVGGLVDYLTTRQARWLLRHLSSQLASGGSLFFTNIAVGNPFRLCMEHVTSWRLNERSAADMRALTADVSVPVSFVLERDQTALALLATLVRQ